jgi:hypothetical protein
MRACRQESVRAGALKRASRPRTKHSLTRVVVRQQCLLLRLQNRECCSEQYLVALQQQRVPHARHLRMRVSTPSGCCSGSKPRGARMADKHARCAARTVSEGMLVENAVSHHSAPSVDTSASSVTRWTDRRGSLSAMSPSSALSSTCWVVVGFTPVWCVSQVAAAAGDQACRRARLHTWQPTRCAMNVSAARMSSTSAASSQKAASWFLAQPTVLPQLRKRV